MVLALFSSIVQAEEPSMTTPELVLQSAHTGVVTGVAFDLKGAVLATVSVDNTLKLWSAQEGYLLQTLDVGALWLRVLPSERQRSAGYLSSVALMPDGKTIVTASWGAVVLWRLGGRNHYSLQSGIVEGTLCPDPYGRWIAVASGSAISILDPKDLHLIRTLQSSAHILAVAVSPDGSRVASGGVDTNLIIWDALTGKKLKTLHGHKDYVRSIVFSRDGQTLYSGSDDKTIRICAK